MAQVSIMRFRAACLAITVVGAFSVLVYAAHPGRGLFEGIGLVLVFTAATAIVAVCTLVLLVVRALRHHARTALACLLVLVLAAFLSRTLLPLRARVLLSEPWLRPYAKRLLVPPPTTRGSGVVGLFRTRAAGSRDGVAYLSIGSFGLFGDAGLAFLPNDARLPTQAGLHIEHLYGPWWRYETTDD